jgi:hypothetical protein
LINKNINNLISTGTILQCFYFKMHDGSVFSEKYVSLHQFRRTVQLSNCAAYLLNESHSLQVFGNLAESNGLKL